MAAHITRNVARLAAERGLTVAEVEKRAGMCPAFLSPVDGSKLRVMGIAAVAKVLGVDPQDLTFGPAGGGATAYPPARASPYGRSSLHTMSEAEKSDKEASLSRTMAP